MFCMLSILLKCRTELWLPRSRSLSLCVLVCYSSPQQNSKEKIHLWQRILERERQNDEPHHKQRRSESKCKQKLGCMQMNAKINCHRLCVSCNHVFVCVCWARLYTQIKSLFHSLVLPVPISLQMASYLMSALANYFEHMSEIIFERRWNKNA